MPLIHRLTLISLSALSIGIAPAMAQSLPLAGGGCPFGYTAVGERCLPAGPTAPPALPLEQVCPTGFVPQGGYCVAASPALSPPLPPSPCPLNTLRDADGQCRPSAR